MTIRVLVADDQDIVRAGLCMILDTQPGITVVGEAADGRRAISMARSLRPDVCLLDIRMPDVDGIEATRQLAGPDVVEPLAVVVITTFDLDEYVYGALRAGAAGFLLKATRADRLVAGIETVASGDALLAPGVTRRLIEEHISRPPPVDGVPAPLRVLTEREREVLLLMARGRSNDEICSDLVVSEATVKTHVNRILSKLELRGRVQAVVLAYETGLVRPGEGG